MFRFAHPEYFFLLLLIPVLIGVYVYAGIKKRRNLKKFGNPELLAELMPNVSRVRPLLKFYLQLAALLFIIIILAQPQFGTKMENSKRQGIEVIIALDVSNSMMAQDIQPSRLDKAKMVLSQLVDGMTDDKIGLIVFAGDAYVQLPITADYVSAKMFLSSISTKMVARQGTAIGSAIDLAIKSFGAKSNAGRAIIVITDGENHEDDAVAAAKLAHDNGIIVDVIGMGKPDGAPIPVPGTMSFWKDKNGNVVVSKLNEQMCREIAAAGQGMYIRSDNTNNAYRVLNKELSKFAKSDIKASVFSDFNEQFQSFAFLALFILLLDFFVFDRRNKRLSKLNIFNLKEKVTKS
jgi:Ca-activated chloride channel family protein